MKCLECGADFKMRFRRTEKFCSENCKTAFYNKIAREKKEKKVCIICGKQFDGRNRKYCSAECQNEGKNARNSKYAYEYAYRYKKPEAEKKPQKKKKPSLSLAKINELARAEGLNYGQYVAKYHLN